MGNPQELAALQAGLLNITDPIERRNQLYEMLREFEEKDPYMGGEAREMLNEQNPLPIRNILQGAATGFAEGVVTPYATRGLMKMFDRPYDPGIPTPGNQWARVGGTLAGGMVGLGKISSILRGIGLGTKAIGGLFGAYGAGQALGNREEMENQKTGMRERLVGEGKAYDIPPESVPIPPYMQPTPPGDPKAWLNVGGQALLSGMSGGLSHKASLLPTFFNRTNMKSLGSQAAEAVGSTGLMLNDSMGGWEGIERQIQDNPEGMKDMGLVVGGMGTAGAIFPGVAHGINVWRNRPRARAAASHAPSTQIPPPPSYPTSSPVPGGGPPLAISRGGYDPGVMEGLRAAGVKNIADLPEDLAQRALAWSLMDKSHGAFFAQDPETKAMMEVMGMYSGDQFDDLGINKMMGGVALRGPDGWKLASQRALTNPYSLHYQPAEGSESFSLPLGTQIERISKPGTFFEGAGEFNGLILGETPNGLLVWNGQRPVEIPKGNMKPDPVAQSAQVEEQKPIDLTRPGRVATIPTSPQDRQTTLQSIYPKLGGIQQMVKEAVEEAERLVPSQPRSFFQDPTQESLPFSDPSLPFEMEDLLKIRNWRMGPEIGSPTRSRGK